MPLRFVRLSGGILNEPIAGYRRSEDHDRNVEFSDRPLALFTTAGMRYLRLQGSHGTCQNSIGGQAE